MGASASADTMIAPMPERRRILMLMNKLPRLPAGGERFAVGLATHLPADRYEVVFCTTRLGAGPGLRAELAAAGVEHIELGRRGRADVLPWARFVAMLRRRRFDVLHAHMFGSNVWGTLFGRIAGVPAIVAHEQTWSFEGQPIRRLLDRELIGRFADVFVAVSQRDRERMIALERVPADKIVVMPNAYIARGAVTETDVRAELGLAPEIPLVGTAAVMRPQKALDVLLDGFARLDAAEPEPHLAIAGSGPLQSRLEERARTLGIAGRTHFLGYREDVPNLLRAVDVAVMSSDYEGSPLFAFECMAHGAPLVSTDVGAVGDVLRRDESVVLVPPRDPAALAAAVQGLLDAPERRRAMAAAARERLTEFEMPAVATRFEELYESLIGARERSAVRAR